MRMGLPHGRPAHVDAADPVVGWRVMAVAPSPWDTPGTPPGSLHGMRERWPTVRYLAGCRGCTLRGHPHDRHGVHAYATLDMAYANVVRPWMVVAETALFGLVQRHDIGWRATEARVMALHVAHDTTEAAAAAALAARHYQLPVTGLTVPHAAVVAVER